MNPTRTFASAMPAHHWHALWIYFTATLIGILVAAEIFCAQQGQPKRRLRQNSSRQLHAWHFLRQTRNQNLTRYLCRAP
jgi:Major intrinsic protein